MPPARKVDACNESARRVEDLDLSADVAKAGAAKLLCPSGFEEAFGWRARGTASEYAHEYRKASPPGRERINKLLQRADVDHVAVDGTLQRELDTIRRRQRSVSKRSDRAELGPEFNQRLRDSCDRQPVEHGARLELRNAMHRSAARTALHCHVHVRDRLGVVEPVEPPQLCCSLTGDHRVGSARGEQLGTAARPGGLDPARDVHMTSRPREMAVPHQSRHRLLLQSGCGEIGCCQYAVG